ncbi:unnamed protein product [Prorocentrum cordatum]|uniref:Uncharacterized protein n=1 Tax=Prorocentrum cordatum TaxID=2364126 RepID=A0ABN9VUV6_9DINO|nr:unnamed protein product [Polarella glacialis]
MARALRPCLLGAAAALLAPAGAAPGEACLADGAGDEISALQVRGLDVRSASGWAPPQAMVTLQVGIGPMPTIISCSVKDLSLANDSLLQLGPVPAAPVRLPSLAQQQPDVIESAFSAGAGGEGWNLGMAVAYLDQVAGLNTPGTTVFLHLGLTSRSPSWTLQTGVISVSGLPEMLPQTMEWKATGPNGEKVGCPPSYCEMPAPIGGSQYDPGNGCGFAPARDNVTQAAPQPGEDATLTFDITPLVAANYTVFQVSTSPETGSQGFWQSAQYAVTSLSFSAVAL